MMSSVRAELLVLRKRTATWVLLGVPQFTLLLFGFLLPYAAYTSATAGERSEAALRPMLPEQLLQNVLNGVPFYVGMFALILGVLTAGSDFGWGTLKTTLITQPRRLRVFAAKLVALAGTVGALMLLLVASAAVLSFAVATVEGAPIDWPSPGLMLRTVAAGWLILCVWALLGAMLAVVTRGTAIAIGLGIVYGLVIEGLLAGFGANIALLEDFSVGLLRTNAYSLAAALGAAPDEGGGPGAFRGPFVGTGQALAVLVAYVATFAGVAALLIRRRDLA